MEGALSSQHSSNTGDDEVSNRNEDHGDRQQQGKQGNNELLTTQKRGVNLARHDDASGSKHKTHRF